MNRICDALSTHLCGYDGTRGGCWADSPPGSPNAALLGSHGMPAHRYDVMLAMIASGKLAPQKLVARTVNLEQSIEVLTGMERSDAPGIAVITDFS